MEAQELHRCQYQEGETDEEPLSGTCNNLKESMHYKYKSQANPY